MQELADNFDEILTSTAAVKGEAFAKAASISFESVQLIELLGRLADLTQEAHKEYAEVLLDSGKTILASVVSKACEDLEEAQFNEAMTMGYTMYKRRNATVDAIRRDLREDGE